MIYVVRGLKYVVLPLAFILLGAFLAASYLIDSFKTLNADGNWFETERGIDTSHYVTLGGFDQFVRIRSRDRNNPVLLKLHGGPGLVSTPWTYRVLRPITEYYTLVEWDQRGAGRSTGDDSIASTINYELMVDDTIELIEYLKAELDVEKVVVVGHSWGAMLSLGVIQKRPDLVHAYVGIGQGLAWPEGFDETQRLITAAAKDAGDTKTVEMLSTLPNEWPIEGDLEAYQKRTTIIQSPLVSYGGALHASKSNDTLNAEPYLDAVISPEVSLREAVALLNTSKATDALFMDLFGRDLRVDLGPEYQVPIFIFQGKFDWVTPTTLVKPWFAKITAPHKEYISFDDSAHMVMNEEPGKFLFELVNRVRPFSSSRSRSD